MNFNLIYNSKGNGYMQELRRAEEMVYQLYKSPIEKWRKEGLNLEELKTLNERAVKVVNISYNKLSVNN